MTRTRTGDAGTKVTIHLNMAARAGVSLAGGMTNTTGMKNTNAGSAMAAVMLPAGIANAILKMKTGRTGGLNTAREARTDRATMAEVMEAFNTAREVSIDKVDSMARATMAKVMAALNTADRIIAARVDQSAVTVRKTVEAGVMAAANTAALQAGMKAAGVSVNPKAVIQARVKAASAAACLMKVNPTENPKVAVVQGAPKERAAANTARDSGASATMARATCGTTTVSHASHAMAMTDGLTVMVHAATGKGSLHCLSKNVSYKGCRRVAPFVFRI